MLRASSITIGIVLCLAVLATAPNHAQQPQAPPTAAGGQGGGRGAGQAGGGAGGRVPAIDERVSGMQKIDGYFPLYWDERSGSLFIEIPRFDSEFLFSTGLA